MGYFGIDVGQEVSLSAVADRLIANYRQYAGQQLKKVGAVVDGKPMYLITDMNFSNYSGRVLMTGKNPEFTTRTSQEKRHAEIFSLMRSWEELSGLTCRLLLRRTP